MDKRTGLPVVGMVGGGQLARMSYQAAIGLGQSLRVLTVPGDERIGRVAPDCRFGDLTSITALREFGGECDLLTVVDDRVSGEHCAALRAEGLSITPGAASMECARDSAALRRQLADLGVADAGNRFAAAGDRFAAAGGGWTSSAGTSDPGASRQLVALVARSPFGQVAVYPVAETVAAGGNHTEVLAPAPGLCPDRAAEAQRLAIDLATALDAVGTLAVELSDTTAGLLVKALVPRPHPAADWTIDAARTSQYEQHLRAVLDYPLGPTEATAPAAATMVVAEPSAGGPSFDERLHHVFASDPGVRVHLHGARSRDDAVIGHVTVVGEDFGEVRNRAARAAHWLREGRNG